MCLCRDCTTNHTMLDDIVSELWRKENVTSGYCPRYRYTLIATLTLANLYYICVCIFFQQGVTSGTRLSVVRSSVSSNKGFLDKFYTKCLVYRL
jgi:hypothetical protein